MDVTRHNQEAAFHDLLALLPQCEFYSLDLEMTGIRATEKDLLVRKEAVEKQKEADAKAAGTPYVPNANAGNGAPAATGSNPLLQHQQLQCPADSYDEKITAASTYNVVQMGISLFFRKDTKVNAPVGTEPLGNTISEEEADVKRQKHSKELRTMPNVTLPLSKEGLKLWKNVDALFRSASTSADINKAILTALGSTTETIANQTKLIEDLTTDMTNAKREISTSNNAIPLESAREVKQKLNFIAIHTEAFNLFSDAVQIKGLIELYERAFLASPSNPPKWKSFEFLFPSKTLSSGKLHKVPAAKETTSYNSAPAPNSASAAASAAQPAVNKFDPNAPGYTTRSFSFYLFPNPTQDGRDMTLNSTTVGDFLAKNSQISFDRWIRHGVYYVSRERLLGIRNEKIKGMSRKLLGTPLASNADGSLSPEQLREKCPSLSPPEIAALAKFITTINEYAIAHKTATANGSALPSPIMMPFLKQDAFEVVRTELTKLGMEKQGKCAAMSTRLAPKASPTAASSQLEYHQLENELYTSWLSENAGATATRVFELLASCKKPIVVQNGWSDLAFLYCTFQQYTPIDLPAFKAGINTMFPKIFDSRTFATLEPFNNFSSRGRLETIYRSFQQKFGHKVNIYVPEVGQELFVQSEKSDAAAAHDASYDAFITGCLFLYEKQAMPTPNDVDKFANIVPCYGSIFSLKLDDPINDVWLTSNPATPIIRITLNNPVDFLKAPRALYSSQTRIKTQLTRQHLPGVIQVPTNAEALYFVESNAKALGVLFDMSIAKAKAEIERDVGFPIKIELLPAKAATEIPNSSVRPFWPAGVNWPTE